MCEENQTGKILHMRRNLKYGRVIHVQKSSLKMEWEGKYGKGVYIYQRNVNMGSEYLGETIRNTYPIYP